MEEIGWTGVAVDGSYEPTCGANVDEKTVLVGDCGKDYVG
jgi:hypothetical protein